MSPASGGQLSGPMGVPLGSGGAHQGHVESSLLHRPSYSINGILGIPQPDANANSIAGIKRKREDGDDGLSLNNQQSIPVSSPVTSVTGYNGNVLNAGDIYNSM